MRADRVWRFWKPRKGMFFSWQGYLAGIILSAIVTFLIYLLESASISVHAEMLYILAIIFTSIYFGLGSAIFTSILSVTVYDYFFVPPLYTFGPRTVQDVPMLVTFLVVGIIISFLTLKLLVSEEKFRRIVETAGEGIVLIDSNTVITYVNKRFLDMLGYSLEEMKGKSILNFVEKNYAGELERRLDNRKRNISEGYEIAYQCKDGSKIWVRIYGSPLFDANGKIIGSAGMHTDITQEKKLRNQLEDYAKRLIQIQEEERKRIARELHDDTAPTLSYLSLELDSIVRKSPHISGDAAQHLKELREKIDTAQENIRRFSHELHPAILDNLGLGPALELLIEEINCKGRMEIGFNIDGTEKNISDDVKLALYRIAQEALNNVWKHSQATKARVNLEYNSNSVILSITDNGVGFSPAIQTKGGLGLIGMKERADLIGADLKVSSENNKGIRVIVEVKA